MKHTFFPMVLSISISFMNFLYISQLALVPWSCLYKNYRVEERWKYEDETTGHFNMAHLWRRQTDWRWLEACHLAEGGCPPSSWGAPGPYRPPLQGAQTGPCPLQALFFTQVLPASVCPGRSSSRLLHDRWGWQSHISMAGGKHCGQWSEEGKKGWQQCAGIQWPLLKSMSGLSLPTPFYTTAPHTCSLGCKSLVQHSTFP